MSSPIIRESLASANGSHLMAAYQAPRGTQDILPEDGPYWAFVEDEMRHQAHLANYSEIRTPTFEETGVFARGVGATTDIVEKEMYTFLDKGGDSMTLRPEATALAALNGHFCRDRRDFRLEQSRSTPTDRVSFRS